MKQKVYKAPGLDPDIPQIRIQGKWLSDLGYHVGDHMIVSIKSGKRKMKCNDMCRIEHIKLFAPVPFPLGKTSICKFFRCHWGT